jgi:hypothetical protein
VFQLAPTATRMHAHVTHASKPMGTGSSAPEQMERDHMNAWTFKIGLNKIPDLYIYALSIH